MHLAEGILSAPVLACGAAATAAGTAAGLKAMQPDDIPRTAVLTSAFFTASLIHVPLGPASAHLVLNGLCGLLLGWMAFPAILTALLLQALLFGYGGVTVLGVNAFNLALPAALFGTLLRLPLRNPRGLRTVFAAGFAAGALALAGSTLLAALSLGLSGREFRAAAALLVAGHVPLMIVEGFVTASACLYLYRVRPEMLGAPPGGEHET
ncbi:cobalt transporter CbiM [Kiritimatiella glycovorans]|uniref:Energy-coupling factor transporter probable substrate-capture protein NikMN n=1 Tax=Kiritimatiella glycovorans TaxID=1307763 RepID=A0A0G3EFK4_9BACT|nr:cobalt transporter CbiM [Kiritimatiella glycovorans]AKJ65128.1 Energy-coupling factor transporter probable substrate-capture protein NikMN [Kiritimatiella glycovorans]